MRDLGHEWTEERIRKLEARIRDAYEDAVIDIEDKMAEFCAKFAVKDRDLQAKLKAGKITKADYQMWLAGQVFQRERWQRTLDDLTATLARANQIAMQIINEETPEAFAYNANWASYTFEREMDRRGWDLNVIRRPGGVEPGEKKEAPVGGARVQFGWGLYSTEAVKILLRDEPDLLPPSRVDIPKDKRWNMKNITRQIMQGIVQGEGVEQVAARLRTVAEMNIDSARTHARTAMTGAQNAGRWEELIRERDLLERFGTTVRKKWKSAKDSRVRESHGILDGQVQELDDPFEVKGKTIMFPGDPDAAPELVYNCRCTMSADYPDSPPQNAKMRDDDPARVPIRSMTFAEWMEYKRGEASGLKKDVESAILSATTKADGEEVRTLCNLKAEPIEVEFGRLNTTEVVLTNERAEHIRIRHPEDYALFEQYGEQTILDPDIVLRDEKNQSTVLMIRKVGETNLNTVIRLSIASQDPQENKNSVMTFYRVRDKNLKKLIAKNKTVYSKDKS